MNGDVAKAIFPVAVARIVPNADSPRKVYSVLASIFVLITEISRNYKYFSIFFLITHISCDILTALAVNYYKSVSEKQLELFNIRPAYRVEQPKELMSKASLLRWKARVFKHQQRTLNTEPPQQTQIFDLPRALLWDEPCSSFEPPKSHCDSNSINPFALKLHPSQFYRMKEHQEKICIYFIIDNALPLLLYVGETMQTAKQRWNGTHDCKDYMMNYVELHRKYDLEVKMCSAFWHDTPLNRTGRLKLESALIKRWQSPFNKENWRKYGKPFGKI